MTAVDSDTPAPRLTTLDPGAGYITIVNTYEVAPERAERLLAFLEQATEEVLRHQPGFVSANLHLSMDRTQLVNYTQWESREAVTAAAADPTVQARIRAGGEIATSFKPVQFELRRSIAAARCGRGVNTVLS